MEKREILGNISRIIDEAKAAIFTTVDEEGAPQTRWMTPALLPGREGAVYAVAYRSSRKLRHVAANPRAQWTFSSPALDRILTSRLVGGRFLQSQKLGTPPLLLHRLPELRRQIRGRVRQSNLLKPRLGLRTSARRQLQQLANQRSPCCICLGLEHVQ